MKLKIHLCCFSAELILLWKPFYPQSSGHFQSSADVTLLLNTSWLFVWSIAVKTVRCRCERSLTVSHLLLFVIFNLKKKKKSMSSIDTSLIFDTREFNVRHLYTGSSPAKQSSYFNHSERERVTARGLIFPQVISNEIHYHLQGWQRASLSKVQSEAGAAGESAGAIPQLLVI